MKLYTISVLALALATTAIPRAAEAMSTTVNCPGDSITGALNTGFDDITVNGTCTEDVEIRQDDVTIQGGTVIGQLTVNGARRVTIQNLTVQGDGTPGKNGIVAINGAAVTIVAVDVDGATTGIAISRASIEVFDSTIQNNSSGGIDFNEGSSGFVANSNIQNNGEIGFSVGYSSTAHLDGNHIVGSPLGVGVGFSGSALLRNNEITTTPSEDAALDMDWGTSVRLAGGNTLTSGKPSGLAIFMEEGATFVQRGGHDTVMGEVSIRSLSNAELRNISITGPMEVLDHSLLRMRDTSGSPINVSVNGNISISQDSGLNFIKFPGDQRVKVIGNITCADTESSISAPPSNVTITGTTKGCTGYDNVSN